MTGFIANLADYVTPSEDCTILVSVLAALEVSSAIRRRQSQGDITPCDAEIALTHLQGETRRVVEQPMTAPLLGVAHGVIDRQSLRMLDSIQLASALVALEAFPAGDQITFVASDRRLWTLTEAEGSAVWNPQESPRPSTSITRDR